MMRRSIILILMLVITQAQLALAETRYANGEERLPLPNQSSRSEYRPYSPQEQEEKQLEAISLYMILMRENDNNAWAPFQLAIIFAQNGRDTLALRYLRLSSQRGLWYYYDLLENSAFDHIRENEVYQQILAETKARYLQQAAGNEGKPFYALPKGDRPAQGWPVVIALHDVGESASISEFERQFYQQLGCIYIELNATQMLSEATFRWSNVSEQGTQQALQNALNSLNKVDKIDTSRVYLLGQGQGSLQAANLLASHPQYYAGALIISPRGQNPLATHSRASNKRIFISYFTQRDPDEASHAKHYAHLFSPHNQVKLHGDKTMENTSTQWKTRYTQPLLWLLGKANNA